MHANSTGAENAYNPLLTRRCAAAYLAISERKLDELAAAGRIPRIRIGTAVRFDRADLDAFVAGSKEVR